uniref:Putative acetyltransferase n=1 Tax=Aegilops tauschii TaxID=37682 RepID=N1QR52_AEGTA
MGDVRIVSRRVVRPEPTASPPVETIHLTPWDLKSITVENIQKGILLPKPPTTGGKGLNDVDVECLASSFERALGHFYPYAGRLSVAVPPASNGGASSPQNQSLTISLRCGGEGAEFVHAVAPGVTVSDITDSLIVPRVVWSFFPLDGLLGSDAIDGSRPLLVAQVTKLADGVFIAMSMNHGVADGTTFWQFFNTWSELSRAAVAGNDVMISTPLPVFDRSFLGSCTVPIPLPFGKLEDVVGLRHVFPPDPSFTRLPARGPAAPTGTLTGSSPRFDVYGNDFGWGAPVTVRSGAGNKFDGKATVYEGRGGGGSIALEVCLIPEALARLVTDEEFMAATTTDSY